MDFNTPVGRLVQGSVKLEHQKDMRTKAPKFNKDGTPEMGVFFALAFPKKLPTGQDNAEFAQFWQAMCATAATAWPQFFPQGAGGPCTNPKFSWKFQDGDGVDDSGQSVADKPGFAGHYIIKFYTGYPMRCFYEGKFGAHEEIQQPEQVLKRGMWVRVFGEMKSNNADMSAQQVPGIVLYPKLMSFVERGEEIVSGPDAQAAFGAAAIGWRPPASASPVGMPGAAMPGMPGPAGVPHVGMPGAAMPGMPGPAGAPHVGMPGAAMPARALPTPPGMALPTPPQVALPMPPAAPQYALSPALVAQNVQMAALLQQGWTYDTLVAAGHATRIG